MYQFIQIRTSRKLRTQFGESQIKVVYVQFSAQFLSLIHLLLLFHHINIMLLQQKREMMSLSISGGRRRSHYSNPQKSIVHTAKEAAPYHYHGFFPTEM